MTEKNFSEESADDKRRREESERNDGEIHSLTIHFNSVNAFLTHYAGERPADAHDWVDRPSVPAPKKSFGGYRDVHSSPQVVGRILHSVMREFNLSSHEAASVTAIIASEDKKLFLIRVDITAVRAILERRIKSDEEMLESLKGVK